MTPVLLPPIEPAPLHGLIRRYICWLSGARAFGEIVEAAGFPPGHFDGTCAPPQTDLDALVDKAALRLGFTPAGLEAEVRCWSRVAADLPNLRPATPAEGA